MSKERELSAALTTVEILEEAGERRDYTQSVLSGLDGKCIEPDAFCTTICRNQQILYIKLNREPFKIFEKGTAY
jgi:hypothetical protein